MATRAGGTAAALCVALLACGAPAAANAQAPARSPVFDTIVHTRPGESGDSVGAERLRSTAAKLMERSPTFASLMESLAQAGHMVMILQPGPVEGLLGHGRYRGANGRITGVITVNTYLRNPDKRVRALAHELAHAFEIACMLPTGDISGLREQYAKRLGRPVPPRTRVETPFARAVERVVEREAHQSVRAPTTLPALAARHGFGGCVDLLRQESRERVLVDP
jgi:hypothetical protein